MVHKALKKDHHNAKICLQAKQLFELFFLNIVLQRPAK